MDTYQVRIIGDPVLKQRAREVEEFDGTLTKISHAMVPCMYDAGGIGLAAPQVGIQKRMFVYDLGEGEEPRTIVNPQIVETSGEDLYNEGCLSVPGMRFEIVRPAKATLHGQDLDGKEVVLEGEGLLARLFLHEVDHLDGILLIDRLDDDQRAEALRAIRNGALENEEPSSSSRL